LDPLNALQTASAVIVIENDDALPHHRPVRH
jgi:hypothetical protein